MKEKISSCAIIIFAYIYTLYTQCPLLEKILKGGIKNLLLISLNLSLQTTETRDMKILNQSK